MRPSASVLDLFAVAGPVECLTGGQGRSVRAGDLVLSPGRDQATQDWLSPLLARLSVQLDQDRGRRPQDLRVAVPIPARDGSWVVDGWAASRFEPGTVTCRDLRVTLAAGHLLYARLATLVPERPAGLDTRTDRYYAAELAAFGEGPLPHVEPEVADLVSRTSEAARGEGAAGPAQLVHADLAGNVLLDRAGAPVIIDFAPAWRPVPWADALCVLDSVLWLEASQAALEHWSTSAGRGVMLRAIVFRLLSDDVPDLDAYARVLSSISVER